MRDQCIDRLVADRRQAQQPGVIAQRTGQPGLGDGLAGWSAQAGDQHQRAIGPVPRGFRGDLQDRLIQPGFADGELGGVHADRQTARPGIDVIAAQRPLPAEVQFTARVERQRMGWDDGAAPENVALRTRQRHQPNSGPATANNLLGSPNGVARPSPMRRNDR